jgi:hypothetical protein
MFCEHGWAINVIDGTCKHCADNATGERWTIDKDGICNRSICDASNGYIRVRDNTRLTNQLFCKIPDQDYRRSPADCSNKGGMGEVWTIDKFNTCNHLQCMQGMDFNELKTGCVPKIDYYSTKKDYHSVYNPLQENSVRTTEITFTIRKKTITYSTNDMVPFIIKDMFEKPKLMNGGNIIDSFYIYVSSGNSIIPRLYIKVYMNNGMNHAFIYINMGTSEVDKDLTGNTLEMGKSQTGLGTPVSTLNGKLRPYLPVMHESNLCRSLDENGGVKQIKHQNMCFKDKIELQLTVKRDMPFMAHPSPLSDFSADNLWERPV